MKIQLERKLTSCADRLQCTACDRVFNLGRIRTLLYNDRGFIQGDICPECMKLKAEQIQQKLRDRAMLLMAEPGLCSYSMLSAHERAIELLESSTEDIKFPSLYQWLIKKLEIFSQASQELEAGRLGLSDHRCGRLWGKAHHPKGRSRLRIFFEDRDQ